MIKEAKKRFEGSWEDFMSHDNRGESHIHQPSVWEFIEKELLLAKEEGRQEVLKAIPKEKRKGLIWLVQGHNNCIYQIHKNLKSELIKRLEGIPEIQEHKTT